MKNSEIVNQITRSITYTALVSNKDISDQQLREVFKEYLPKLPLGDLPNMQHMLKDDELYFKVQKILEMHQQVASRIDWLQHQVSNKLKSHVDQISSGAGKKITRAALARRHQKNQQQIRKDQIFVRLTPKSQACIQFMLCNRNFPRMQCKLSCNQHLEYLVNYLTNKWIRGKVGYKIVLYPDSTFLKSMPLSEKQKALKEPLNNYLMFTDIMTCCGIFQNGVLNLCYEIMEIKKNTTKNVTNSVAGNAEGTKNQIEQPNGDGVNYSPQLKNKPEINTAKQKGKCSELNLPQLSNNFLDKGKMQQKQDHYPIRIHSPNKMNSKDQYMREASMFNRNSNFYNNNQQSLFGSLGFNFGFGITPTKKQQHMLSINSINYLDPHFHQAKKQKEERQREKNVEKEEKHQIKIQTKESEKQEKSLMIEPKVIKEEKKQNRQQRQNVFVEQKSIKQDNSSQDRKLGTLMSFLQQIEKQKEGQQPCLQLGPEQSQNNNSNRLKDVKMVNIVKKRAANN